MSLVSPEGALLLKVEQAAAICNIGRSAVYEALRRGDLQSVRIGASRRIPVPALEAWIARLRGGEQA